MFRAERLEIGIISKYVNKTLGITSGNRSRTQSQHNGHFPDINSSTSKLHCHYARQSNRFSITFPLNTKTSISARGNALENRQVYRIKIFFINNRFRQIS